MSEPNSSNSIERKDYWLLQIKLVTGHIVYVPTTMGTKEIAALIYALGNANA